MAYLMVQTKDGMKKSDFDFSFAITVNPNKLTTIKNSCMTVRLEETWTVDDILSRINQQIEEVVNLVESNS